VTVRGLQIYLASFITAVKRVLNVKTANLETVTKSAD